MVKSWFNRVSICFAMVKLRLTYTRPLKIEKIEKGLIKNICKWLFKIRLLEHAIVF